MISKKEINLSIRPYAEGDQAAVIELWHLCFPDQLAHNKPEDDIRRKMKVQKELFFVAESDGKIVGTTLSGYDGHRGWVHLVATYPAYRRRGIGEALMRRCEKELAAIGCPKVNLQVRATNHEIIAFYKKIGYTVEERVSMGKKLI